MGQGPVLMILGVVLIIIGIFIRPKDAPWEWSPIWGLAGESTLPGKLVCLAGIAVLLAGGLYLRGGSLAPGRALPPVSAASQKEACAKNRDMIEYAKDQMYAANGLKPGAALTQGQVQQLGAYMRDGWAAVRCPAGGCYEVNKIGERPRCSVHGQ
jgi:hypothetical protein